MNLFTTSMKCSEVANGNGWKANHAYLLFTANPFEPAKRQRAWIFIVIKKKHWLIFLDSFGLLVIQWQRYINSIISPVVAQFLYCFTSWRNIWHFFSTAAYCYISNIQVQKWVSTHTMFMCIADFLRCLQNMDISPWVMYALYRLTSDTSVWC